MWVLLMVFFSNFQMGFYVVTTGWIFEIGLCENSIQFNSNLAMHPFCSNWLSSTEAKSSKS